MSKVNKYEWLVAIVTEDGPSYLGKKGYEESGGKRFTREAAIAARDAYVAENEGHGLTYGTRITRALPVTRGARRRYEKQRKREERAFEAQFEGLYHGS